MSSTNHSGTPHHPKPKADTPEDDFVQSSSLQYRCVQCQKLFPTTDAFRQHYLVEHLGRTSNPADENQAINSNVDLGQDDQSGTVTEMGDKSESPSFCKRCRGRILSSSEDDEEMNEGPSHKSKKHKTGKLMLQR